VESGLPSDRAIKQRIERAHEAEMFPPKPIPLQGPPVFIMPIIEPLTHDQFPAVLALNAANVEATSALDTTSLSRLVGEACYARGIGGGRDAFLIAMDQDADYASPNFQWFRERFPRFVYIDRIITAEHARGRGLARALYEDLFAEAGRHGHGFVGCEVNLEPANSVSDVFHAALGFVEIGRASIYGGAKTVRYYERRIIVKD
jgi:predicted GNAT superfamily acetyltransferase